MCGALNSVISNQCHIITRDELCTTQRAIFKISVHEQAHMYGFTPPWKRKYVNSLSSFSLEVSRTRKLYWFYPMT